MELLSLPGFREYVLCAALLVIKLCTISLAVSSNRVGGSVYNNPEDDTLWPKLMRSLGLIKSQPKEKDDRTRTERRSEARADREATVERIRRAHMNAIENVVPFLTIGFLYCVCGLPRGIMHFYVFTACRYLHTVFYAVLGVQPWRTIVHFTAMTSLLSMSVRLVLFALARA